VSLAKANGAGVVKAVLSLPRVGAWHADLEIDSEDASRFAKAVELSVGDGALTFAGTAYRGGAYGGRVIVRVVGGAGGFGKQLDPKAYRQIPAKIVLTDILDGAGEKLSGTADAGPLSAELAFWSRPKSLAGAALTNLVDALESTWRVLADGTVWVGAEAWPAAKVKNPHVIHEAPDDGRIEFGSDLPSLLPGTTFLDKKVTRVVHHFDPKNVHTEAWFERG
jgi:hypothetical protein